MIRSVLGTNALVVILVILFLNFPTSCFGGDLLCRCYPKYLPVYIEVKYVLVEPTILLLTLAPFSSIPGKLSGRSVVASCLLLIPLSCVGGYLNLPIHKPQ